MTGLPISSATAIVNSDSFLAILLTGRWLTAYVRATFSEEGDLRMIIVDEAAQEVVFDISEQGLDMWRGTAGDHFVRPKWGIYRSLAEKEDLRAEEEVVRFANFEVEKVRRQ